MAKLTDRRMEKARPIFDRYRARLHETHDCDVQQLETELKDCFNLGYQEIKDIIADLLKHDHYKYLAAYFMQNINSAVGVVSEFHDPLAKLYGLDYYYADDQEEKCKAFWDLFFAGDDPAGR